MSQTDRPSTWAGFTFVVEDTHEDSDTITRLVFVEASNLSDAIAAIEDDNLNILHIFEDILEDLHTDE
jgi:hypothetical protein